MSIQDPLSDGFFGVELIDENKCRSQFPPRLKSYSQLHDSPGAALDYLERIMAHTGTFDGLEAHQHCMTLAMQIADELEKKEEEVTTEGNTGESPPDRVVHQNLSIMLQVPDPGALGRAVGIGMVQAMAVVFLAAAVAKKLVDYLMG